MIQPLLLALCLIPSPPASLPLGAQEAVSPAELVIGDDVDLDGSFSFFVSIRLGVQPEGLPIVASNKDWESGEVRDYTTNNSYGLGRESGTRRGFALSVLPDGAWTWNMGDGKARLDHRPEVADQGVGDGVWHELGFAVDRANGIVHLFFDGRRVAIHDLQGLGGVASEQGTVRFGAWEGAEIKDARFLASVASPSEAVDAFAARFGDERRPEPQAVWDGRPLKVLAWNIWHGGRRKGRDEGVQRVVEVIEESGADIVLMQETYGSGPRISGRLGFDYYLRSSNLSIMSRYPIKDVHRMYQGFRFGGATIELRPGTTVEAYSLWINYLPSVQKELEAEASPEQLVAEDDKTRGKEMRGILAELMPHLDRGPAVPVIVGGDFNSGSHLDWTEEATEQENHGGRVVTWPVSVAMAREGFQDTFRTRHPSPVSHPGLTWSPEFPESHQERIDYVYVRAGDWEVVDSKVLSSHPRGWPSDHAAVLSTMQLKEPAPSLDVLSYNIHYGIGMDKKLDLERIAGAILSRKPHIVGLQEIGNKAMADELGRLTGMKAVFGASKGSDDGYGDAILCNLPFEWVGNVSLPSASSSRYQAMAVDVDLSSLYGEGARVRFINTHFDWTDSVGSKESRRAAVRVIEKGLDPGAQELAILTGDLNAIPGSAPLQDLAERGWHLTELGQPMLTWGAPNPTKQIDYVLPRPRSAWRILNAEVLDEPVASDHYPVLLSLRLAR